MSYLIPSWDIAVERREDFRRATIEAMIERCVVRGIASDRYSICVRKLSYTDLGLKCWRTPKQATNKFTEWVKVQVPSNSIFSVSKVTQISLNPKVSQLRVRLGFSGSTTLALHELDELYGILPLLKKLREYRIEGSKEIIYGIENLKMEGFFSEPIILTAEDFVSIDVCSPEGNKKGDRLVLGGFVAEPIGFTIS